MRHPGELERLYDELAKRIHAKDDEGVRRVFRELLDAGRSRQEIMSEIVRIIDAKPPNHGENSDNGTGAQQAFEPSQTEWRQKRSTWPDSRARKLEGGNAVNREITSDSSEEHR